MNDFIDILRDKLTEAVNEINLFKESLSKKYNAIISAAVKEEKELSDRVDHYKTELGETIALKNIELDIIASAKKDFDCYQEKEKGSFSRVVKQENERLKKEEEVFYAKKKDYKKKEDEYLVRYQKLLEDEEEIRQLRVKTEKIYNDFVTKDKECVALKEKLDLQKMEQDNTQSFIEKALHEIQQHKADNAKVSADLNSENARLVELNKLLGARCIAIENDKNSVALVSEKLDGLSKKLNKQNEEMENERRYIKQARSDLQQKENNLKALQKEIDAKRGRNEA